LHCESDKDKDIIIILWYKLFAEEIYVELIFSGFLLPLYTKL